jgi:CBS domain-containing protein
MAFIAIGFFRFFTGAGFGGLWLALIGWFLASASASSYTMAEASVALSHVRVSDVMSRDCATVDGNLDLNTFAENYFLSTGRRCFAVVHDGRPAGLVTVNELKQVDRKRWPFTRVAQVALPLDTVRTVPPDTPLSEALELMLSANVNQLPVIANGELVGMVGRADVLQYLQTRAELKAA